MINDFLKKFLNKEAIIDKYGLKTNFNFSEEISKISSQIQGDDFSSDKNSD